MGYPSPSVYWNQRISVKSQSNLWRSITCGQNLEPQGLSLDITILVRYTVEYGIFEKPGSRSDEHWGAVEKERRMAHAISVPQRLKPVSFDALDGTAEAMPFPNRTKVPSSSNILRDSGH
jgi:hypothetical protein